MLVSSAVAPPASNIPAGISLKPIEQIRKGDLVLTRNEKTGKSEVKKVLRTTILSAPAVVTLSFADTKTHKIVETITATREHPFMVEGDGFDIAGRLAHANAKVTRAGPALTVAKIDWKQGKQPVVVYNFEVEEDHTYFVGSANGGLWVHNYDYRTAFLEANPHINPTDIAQVHHAIPQAVLNKYPGLFTDAEIHAVENLRGISSSGVRGHQKVTDVWRKFYDTNPQATRDQITDMKDTIDKAIGQHFIN